LKSIVRAVEAARSLSQVLRDPDDTKQVFRLFEAVSGGTPSAFRDRFEKSRGGAKLLEDMPDLLSVLRDQSALEAMPDGSLGRAYLAFMRRDGLTADALVSASETGASPRADTKHAFIDARLRDSHDLWHVVTGYGGDLVGEAALLAFSYAQTWSPGVGLLVSLALYKGDPDARRLVVDGFVRGSRAAWLPVQAWETMLTEPLDAVRERLRVGPPPSYEPFYARDLPPGGLWASEV
jgi:ubiquinone biosynthesis protein COQ4